MMNKLEAMKAFCLIAEYGSFSQAANTMNISATMVSRYVKQLEQELGCLLFKRNTRKVFLTDAGEQYRTKIKPLISEINTIDEQMKQLKKEPAGQLNISASNEFGAQYLAPLIALYRAEYPQINLNIELTNTPVDLYDDKTDLAFRVAPELVSASYIAQQVCSSRLSLWASPAYINKYKEPKNLAELAQHQLLFFNHSLRKEQWIFNDNAKHKLMKFKWAWTSNSGKLLNEAAADGQGIIQAPSYSVAKYINSGDLIEIMPKYAFEKLKISAIYPHRYELSVRVKTFVEFSKRYFAEHPIP